MIQKEKDLNILSLDALKTHEIELIQAHDNVSKKGKNVALKSLQKTAGPSLGRCRRI